jgi:teichuronic acid biosynthesis glycosyltransferase TuaC
VRREKDAPAGSTLAFMCRAGRYTTSMLRVLTLSTLFPNARQPTLGIFVERQTRGLAARDDVELEVVAPIGMPRWPLSLHPHYAPRSALPAEESWQGLPVHRPRYPVLPVIGSMWTAGCVKSASVSRST